jgi:two-component system cell cycle sensor histidine kinase PleC
MSHELRTPLNAIIGFSEVIHRDDLVPKDRYPEYAKHIYDAGIHLLTIVDQILDLARIEAGKLAFDEKLVSIMDIIRPCIDTVRRLAKDKSVTITSRSSIARRLILLDPVRMKQVLINLLANAVKFTGEGGRIAVTATIGTSGELVISVADTGIGIRSGDLERVLRPFEQAGDPFCRQKQGSGLGLPIARALVKLHGGDLVLESEFGRGTIASIHLPGDRIKSMESIPSEITQ